jgi:hypothetical protein
MYAFCSWWFNTLTDVPFRERERQVVNVATLFLAYAGKYNKRTLVSLDILTSKIAATFPFDKKSHIYVPVVLSS